MQVDTRIVSIESAGGELETCELIFDRGSPLNVLLRSEHIGALEGSGSDLFAALCDLRLQLEHQGHVLLCNAARLDAYPSPLSRQMSSGRQVTLMRIGTPAGKTDLVDGLDPAQRDQIGSVADQRSYFEKWIRSLGL